MAEEMKFEDKLKELETLVSGMESGSMKLDEMIAAFERGRRLSTELQKDLASIRLKIEKVTKSGTTEELKI